MRRGFLLIRAEEAREQGTAEAKKGLDELGRLLFVDADQLERVACDHVTTNQNDSQHAICELIRQSAVKAFGHEVGREGRSGPSAGQNEPAGNTK